ncbi:MAG TPA: undecaprenyldiphospho-muramoylpentapeptide beta-N-acetylglucosaminyltransferase [Usitatibacter sp.]|nr:undecaprenyldiphospho-muramoylpentapeptide beta-N-acetylglucosaminyltransferase [Usitatibacter sp.]
MKRTILIMAAGTGGHIFPGLAIARDLELRGWDVRWMGTPWGMENQIVRDVGYPMVNVNISGVRGKGGAAWLFLPFRILIGFLQSTVAIFRIRPDVMLSLGGYVAFPGGMMAALWRKPLVVHEPGAVAGITNRFLAAVADRVIVGMEGAFDRKVATGWANRIPKPRRVDWLGTPVREEIAKIAQPDQRYGGRNGALRLLIVGGSLGAQTMNDLVLAALASMPAEKRPQVVHQSGQKLHDKLQYEYRHAHVEAEVVPFIDDMARRYAWCDLLICRSGAVTVAEIAAAGVASILFPLPWFVVDEQTANARFLADRDAGIALQQLDTKPEQLAEILLGLDRDRLATMARNARALGKPDATRRCADVCVELAHAA